MNKCQSTASLVESRKPVLPEDMLPIDLNLKYPPYAKAESISPNLNSAQLYGVSSHVSNIVSNRFTESPMSVTSGPSSEDQTAWSPQSTTTQPSAERLSTNSGESIIYECFVIQFLWRHYL